MNPKGILTTAVVALLVVVGYQAYQKRQGS